MPATAASRSASASRASGVRPASGASGAVKPAICGGTHPQAGDCPPFSAATIASRSMASDSARRRSGFRSASGALSDWFSTSALVQARGAARAASARSSVHGPNRGPGTVIRSISPASKRARAASGSPPVAMSIPLSRTAAASCQRAEGAKDAPFSGSREVRTKGPLPTSRSVSVQSAPSAAAARICADGTGKVQDRITALSSHGAGAVSVTRSVRSSTAATPRSDVGAAPRTTASALAMPMTCVYQLPADPSAGSASLRNPATKSAAVTGAPSDQTAPSRR